MKIGRSGDLKNFSCKEKNNFNRHLRSNWPILAKKSGEENGNPLQYSRGNRAEAKDRILEYMNNNYMVEERQKSNDKWASKM